MACSWAEWKFNLGFDARAGLVITLASIYDIQKGRYRRVMYKGLVSELFVPYMNPTRDWYEVVYMDAGEYGLGMSTSSLQPMTECPSNAVFIDAYYALWNGTPAIIPNAYCIFERFSGDVAWRHTGFYGSQNVSINNMICFYNFCFFCQI